MKTQSLIIFLFFFGIISVPLRNIFFQEVGSSYRSEKYTISEAPPCLKMFSSIEKYSREYRVPLKYALGIAYEETRYGGPFDWDYDHRKISSAGALGPMQIMPGTAKWMWGDNRITREKILGNIDFNVKTSMKLLRYLHDKYKNWKIVFGYYNTGTPCINSYAEKVYNFKPNNNEISFD
jgi:hypothetical protein